MLSRAYFITCDDEKISHARMAEEACRGGVKLLQLRTKGREYASWLELAREVKGVCDRYAAKLIVNDSVAIAKALRACGVHLGKSDMPVAAAREELGSDCVIGATANTSEDILKLVNAGADYIGVGPFRFTTTKKELSPVLGVHGITELVATAAKARSEVPLFAIGGIGQTDILPLLQAGVYGVAVSSAIAKAESMQNSAARFVQILEGIAV